MTGESEDAALATAQSLVRNGLWPDNQKRPLLEQEWRAIEQPPGMAAVDEAEFYVECTCDGPYRPERGLGPPIICVRMRTLRRSDQTAARTSIGQCWHCGAVVYSVEETG